MAKVVLTFIDAGQSSEDTAQVITEIHSYPMPKEGDPLTPAQCMAMRALQALEAMANVSRMTPIITNADGASPDSFVIEGSHSVS